MKPKSSRVISFRVPLSEFAQIAEAAEQAGQTPGEFARDCIERARAAEEGAAMEARMEKIIRGMARRQLGAVLHYIGGRPPEEAKEIATKMTGGEA